MTAIIIAMSTIFGSVSISEKEVVAACLILEAGGEGEKGMEAVLSVINNRSHGDRSRWYSTVVRKKQFSCFNSGVDNAVKRAKNHPKWNFALDLVENFKGDIVNGATHYHVWTGKSKVSPYWTHPSYGGKNKKAIVTGVIGNHVFLKNVD